MDVVDLDALLVKASEGFAAQQRELHRLEAELHETKRRWDEEKVKHRLVINKVDALENECKSWEKRALSAEQSLEGWETTFDNATRTIEAQAKEIARMATESHQLKVAYDQMAETFGVIEHENQELKALDAYKLRKERDLYKRAFSWAHDQAHKLAAMTARDKKEIEE